MKSRVPLPAAPYLIAESLVIDEGNFDAAASAPLAARIEKVVAPLVGWLPWIWIAGTPLTLFVVITGVYGAERMRRGAVLVVYGPVADAFDRAATVLRLGRGVAVAVSDRVVTPLVLGIFKPLVLLPSAAITGWSPAQLEMILLHELAHVRRWDNLVNLLQRVVEAVLFYQPAVWFASNWVRLEREHCCDAVVLAHGNEPQQYAETLASLAMPGISPQYAAAALASHQLVSRIRHILKVEDRTMKISRKAVLIVVGFFALMGTLVVAYAGQETDGPTPPVAAATDAEKTSEGAPKKADVPASEPTSAEANFNLVHAKHQAMADERQRVYEHWKQRVKDLDGLLTMLRGKAILLSGDNGEKMIKTAEEELARAQSQLAQSQTALEQAIQVDKVASFYVDDVTKFLGPSQNVANKDLVVDFLWSAGAKAEAKHGWSPEQIVGPPDAQAGMHDRRAWASGTQDGQAEWIEASYEKPVQAVAVVIFETFNPGAISSVKVFEAEDKWYWALERRTAQPLAKSNQVTTVAVHDERPINKVRITIESVAVPGYNEIDAVGLLDAKGEIHWATSAAASSWGTDSAAPGQASDYLSAVNMALAHMQGDVGNHFRAHLGMTTNCASCHTTTAAAEWNKYLLSPKRSVLAEWITQSKLPQSQQQGDAATASAGDSSAAEREQRLTQLRNEIEAINQELAKIQEEVELEQQRTKRRDELEQLRQELQRMRKAPERDVRPQQQR
jgi:beta-lactamase regulating signal transducer with metallopeptidase domain